MKLDLTGVKGFIATVLIVLSLIVGVLNAVQNALPPTVESLGVTNFDTLQVGDGSVSEPAFGFTSDTDTGLYRIGANDLGLAVNGTKVGEFTASGFVGSVGTANQSNITNLGTQAYLTATNATVTNGTITSLAVGGGYSSTGCDLTDVGNVNCAGNAAIGGTATITGDVTAGTVYVNGYLRSSNGPVTAFDPFTALKEFTATKGIIINGNTYTYTEPITISGVLTNVQLLYYQLP